MTETNPKAEALASDLLTAAKKAGADAADVVIFSGEALSVTARKAKLEQVERDEFIEFGLRVMLDAADGGVRLATVSASDPSPAVLQRLSETAVAMASEAPSDPYAGLATETMASEDARQAAALLDLSEDGPGPQAEGLLADALALEEAAAAIDGVSQVEGASASWRRSWTQLATSAGFSAGYLSSYRSLSVSAVAGEATDENGMERDYAFSTARQPASLRKIDEIGREAGERAVRRRSPRKGRSGAFPVVFEPRVAASFVSAIASAANGASVARGSSFLIGKHGEQILPESFQLWDDPTFAAGLGARPFDGEGAAGVRKALIKDGVLSEWLLDSASAKQLGLPSNGSAARGAQGSPRPSVSTAWLTSGEKTPHALIAEIEQGLFVTEMMGGGVNTVTGEYSRGAAGFWIENGQIVFPVSELTVAGSFLDMLRDLEAANDLVFDRRICAPTLRVSELTVATNG